MEMMVISRTCAQGSPGSKLARMRLSAGLLVLAAVHACAADVRLSQEDRQAEVEWLSSLGLKVREGGPLLERPFDPPFTNRSLLVPTAWWRDAPLREIAPDALRMDLPLLRTVMQKAYGGWSSAEKRGWNWDSWFADWDRDLAAKGSAKVSVREALATVGKLMDFQLDNHTGPVGAAGFGSGSRTAVLESTPGGTCTEMETAEGKRFDLDPKDPGAGSQGRAPGGLPGLLLHLSGSPRNGNRHPLRRPVEPRPRDVAEQQAPATGGRPCGTARRRAFLP
jgi:hypothetical protein